MANRREVAASPPAICARRAQCPGEDVIAMGRDALHHAFILPAQGDARFAVWRAQISSPARHAGRHA